MVYEPPAGDPVEPGYAKQTPPPARSGPGPQGYWGPPPVAAAPAGGPSRVGPVAVVVAFVVATAGTFALPLNSFMHQDIGYVETRNVAAQVNGAHPGGRVLYSWLAQFWWRYGVLVAFAALAVLLCVVLSSVAAARVTGWLLAALAVVAGVLQALALAQSANYRAVVEYAGYGRTNMYDNAAIGIWVAFVGFVLLVVAGIIVAVTSRSHGAGVTSGPYGSPPPLPQGPAAPRP